MKLIIKLYVVIHSFLLLSSCQPSDPLLSPKSVAMTASPSTITTSQNLKLVATVIFEGQEGSPAQFSVRFLDGAKILTEGIVSGNETVTKDIPVTKSMNGILTIKAKVFFTGSPEASNIESQPVTVTINIP
jgi:hypothetical protein